ncbi:hypothetical protein EVG20_g10552 [Dentipellis fragilis]|uniref:Uncharacterized protein n=1 Tax=Dentipellis fragilis TaxID=205917 RepID=A0A4Y9XSR2_9AGAM|nr:hypothetical protein EVG20_g10552 [Dentipellis fragilis]
MQLYARRSRAHVLATACRKWASAPQSAPPPATWNLHGTVAASTRRRHSNCFPWEPLRLLRARSAKNPQALTTNVNIIEYVYCTSTSRSTRTSSSDLCTTTAPPLPPTFRSSARTPGVWIHPLTDYGNAGLRARSLQRLNTSSTHVPQDLLVQERRLSVFPGPPRPPAPPCLRTPTTTPSVPRALTRSRGSLPSFFLSVRSSIDSIRLAYPVPVVPPVRLLTVLPSMLRALRSVHPFVLPF